MNMKTRIAINLLFMAITAMVLSFSVFALAGDVVIIANKDVQSNSISSDDLRNIFLAKKTSWDNGVKIDFVTLKDCDTNNNFLKTYLQKTSSQFNRYFRTMVFTGKGKAPRTFATEDELVGYVSGTEGAIGYVSSGTNIGSAKVLSVN